MSKQINRRVLMALVLSLAVSSVLLSATATGSQPQGTSAATATRNAAIVSTTVSVLKETSEIRHLPILRPVKSGAQSRADIERMVVRNLDEQTTPAEMHSSEVALKKLGLTPANFQYRAFIIKLLTEQVAGYYDPKAQQFYLADWIELEGQKPVMAHELTHALQDQHFGLRRFEKWPKGDSDAELAAHSLIEGDATLAMTLYMARNPLVALAFMRSLGAGGVSAEQYQNAPRALRESLVFPYEQGLEWATQLYKRGGWEMISAAFTKLPQSSEQILHPEKYFAGEAPLKIALPEIKNHLGPNWKRLEYDVNGEWSYYLILDQFLNAPAESKRAAAGWAGDRYSLYEGQNAGEVLIAQLSAWDTENDAREFFEAYAKRTTRRYTSARAFDLPNSSKAESAADAAERLFAWHTAEGDVVMEIRGRRILVIEGVPENVDANQLRRALWQ